MLLYIITDSNNKVLSSSTTPFTMDGHTTIEVEITQQLYNEFALDPGIYTYQNNTIVKNDSYILDVIKQRKIDELDMQCKHAITSGFTHDINGITYWFNYDQEAQGNFRDGRDALKDGLTNSIPWTVRIGIDGEYTRININSIIMDELRLASLQHKTSNISKYRDVLMPIVTSATTVQEVEAVTW